MSKTCHCIAIMQMEGVACLGEMDTPGGSARSSRKESQENVLSQRRMYKGKAKMGIFIILTIIMMKIILATNNPKAT